MVNSRLSTRATAERVSLTALRSDGGLQLASVVECAVGRVASDVIALLNRDTPAAGLARDSLIEGKRADPPVASSFSGLVPQAMQLLAGYGIYVMASTDRFVGRMLEF